MIKSTNTQNVTTTGGSSGLIEIPTYTPANTSILAQINSEGSFNRYRLKCQSNNSSQVVYSPVVAASSSPPAQMNLTVTGLTATTTYTCSVEACDANEF